LDLPWIGAWRWRLKARHGYAPIDQILAVSYKLLDVCGRHQSTHDQEALLVKGDILPHADTVAFICLERLHRVALDFQHGGRDDTEGAIGGSWRPIHGRRLIKCWTLFLEMLGGSHDWRLSSRSLLIRCH